MLITNRIKVKLAFPLETGEHFFLGNHFYVEKYLDQGELLERIEQNQYKKQQGEAESCYGDSQYLPVIARLSWSVTDCLVQKPM